MLLGVCADKERVSRCRGESHHHTIRTSVTRVLIAEHGPQLYTVPMLVSALSVEMLSNGKCAGSES